MTKTKTKTLAESRSILASVHESAKDLHDAGAIDVVTMRRFDALCLPLVRNYTSDEVRGIREKVKVSQAVFASVLNVGKATVAAWEQGTKTPSGASLKLLDLVERRGLEALT
jgi:putative transcriptional regulator